MLKKHLDELVVSKNQKKVLEQIAKTAQNFEENSPSPKKLSLSPQKKINRLSAEENLFLLPNIEPNFKYFFLINVLYLKFF